MPDLDPAALATMTADIVCAYVAKNSVRAADMPALIAAVHGSLAGLGTAGIPAAEAERPVPPVPIRKSVTDEYIVSLEDGKRYQSLKRHLSGRGLTPEAYRTKWGLAADYPMVAPGYSARRSELAKSIGLGSLRKRA